jgi:hypothetical protein
MKIYITNIPPSTIKSLNLEKYLLNKNGYKKYELTSEDFGTHIIENKKMYRIEPTITMDLHLINNYNGYNLLVDRTNYVQIPIVSQFPLNYVLTKMICFEYCINKKSGIKLIIEYLIENSSTSLLTSFEKEIIPINFYFTSTSESASTLNIDDNLLEEINMFLLELN